MTRGGWFKAGTRWHYATDVTERALCGLANLTRKLQDEHGRECARCARRKVAAEVEAQQAAYRATLGPAQPMTMRPLTAAEQADVASLVAVRRERGR